MDEYEPSIRHIWLGDYFKLKLIHLYCKRAIWFTCNLKFKVIFNYTANISSVKFYNKLRLFKICLLFIPKLKIRKN